MAKKRKKRTTKRKKKKTTPTVEVVAVVCLILSIIGLFHLGFIGTLVDALLRTFVGELYVIGAVLIIGYCGYILLKDKKQALFPRSIRAILYLFPIILLAIHAVQYESIAMSPDLSVSGITWQNIKLGFLGRFDAAVGGGMIGAVLYELTHFLFSQIGTYIVVILAIIWWVAWIFGLRLEDFITTFRWLWSRGVSYSEQEVTHTLKQLVEHQQALKQRARSTKSKPQRQRMNQQEKSSRVQAKEQTETQAIPDMPPIPDESDMPPMREEVPIVGPTPQQSETEPTKKQTTSKSSTAESQAEPADDIAMDVSELENEDYELPDVSLLDPAQHTDQSGEYRVIKENIKKLERTLKSFNVDAKVTKANLGPSVTKYEIQPAVGTKVSKITNLSDDIALALAAKDIRIEAPIPGKSVIGIEVPNQTVSVVSFRDIVENAPKSNKLLEVALGRDISGNIITSNLAKLPHLLVAGSTGSGKSVAINGMIVNLLLRAKPNEVKMMMIDPKKVELTVYNGIPHLLTPVVTNPRKAAGALNKVVEEMERRYELFADAGQRNIDGYNHYIRTQNAKGKTAVPILPYIVVIVDELADLMMVASKEVEAAITRLAQMARAAGIHMILATQRPSVDVITGIIKANVPSRIGFAVSSGTDSRTIIDQNGAEKLLGRGDMLYLPMGEGKPIRVQGAYIADDEVARVVDFVKNQQEAHYVETMKPEEPKTDTQGEDLDELWQDALNFVETRETISISMLQRRFRIGYNRAARMIEDMEARNIVGPQDGSKPRKVNITEKTETDNRKDRQSSEIMS
ncbi:MAG: DNA translocase FtsK [Aerococcus sp.]|nr:DNA translocase FtsK [Aerococcus sp.]